MWVLQKDGSYYDEETKQRLTLREGLTLDEYLGRQERPPAAILAYGDFERRWTEGELAGLFYARKTTWQVDRYITLAAAQGHVNLSGKAAATVKALFVQMGVLTEDRAEAIFAV